MFGQEMCFPGWQVFRQQVNLAQCKVMRDEVQFKRLLSRKITEDLSRFDHEQCDKVFVEGDWLVYELSDAEAKKADHPVSASSSFLSVMSLPCKVVQVRDKMLVVQMLGMPSHRRDVPVAVCRKLKYDVPKSLQRVAVDMIKFEVPKVPTAISIRNVARGPASSWQEVVSAGNKPGAKRHRGSDMH
eukprot:Lankesteria_metandrocarpae@DN5471_c1_g3_i3.p1